MIDPRERGRRRAQEHDQKDEQDHAEHAVA
jgi:hypothetical protein